MPNLSNVKFEIRPAVANDTLAAEVANALDGLFTVETFKRHRAFEMQYRVMHAKPTKTVADALLLDREVLTLGLQANELQVRTLHVALDLIQNSQGRLDPKLMLVVHSDKGGDEKLRNWGREQGLKVIPIYRSGAGALPGAEALRTVLAQDLFAQDPFSVTGPVLADADFFGRRNNAIDTLRQLQSGRIISMFGLRKLGKTSLINRVVTLARDAGAPRVAMIDCSVDAFNSLDASSALKAVAKACKLAANHGYAHISEAIKRTDADLVPVFDDLWKKGPISPLAIVFDEVDYITPSSPNRPHWKTDFNVFWREFRVVCQEAQRMGFPISILVSGVSSQAFRVESFNGIENAVLHFVPEGYLAPFAREASKAMLKDLCRRCGLSLKDEDLEQVAETCGDFPYWIRLAGSYIHRSLEVQGRPIKLDSSVVDRLLEEFVIAEGSDVASVAFEDLRRKYGEPVDLLFRNVDNGPMPLAEGKLLLRYGIASQLHSNVIVSSAMVRAAANAMRAAPTTNTSQAVSIGTTASTSLSLHTEEWAEELSVINRRRNLLERKLREFLHFGLKFSSSESESWAEKVLKSLPERQRTSLTGLSGDALLSKLYWKELATAIGKNWQSFESSLGDKKRFEAAMDLLNDRPDAHAKAIDAADVALYRRELTWLEERLT